MAWSNLANLFRGSSHDFCQLYYNIKQIDFIFLCFCTVIDHRWRHSVWRTKSHALDCVSCVLFCSSHAMTSSVIYYSTDARKNEIYLLNKTQYHTSHVYQKPFMEGVEKLKTLFYSKHHRALNFNCSASPLTCTLYNNSGAHCWSRISNYNHI